MTEGIGGAFHRAYDIQFVAKTLKVDSATVRAALNTTHTTESKVFLVTPFLKFVGSTAGRVMGKSSPDIDKTVAILSKIPKEQRDAILSKLPEQKRSEILAKMPEQKRDQIATKIPGPANIQDLAIKKIFSGEIQLKEIKASSAAQRVRPTAPKAEKLVYGGKEFEPTPLLIDKLDAYVKKHPELNQQTAFDSLANAIAKGKALNDDAFHNEIQAIVHPPKSAEQQQLENLRLLFHTARDGLRPDIINKHNFKYTESDNEIKRIEEAIARHKDGIARCIAIINNPTTLPKVKQKAEDAVKILQANIGPLQSRLEREKEKVTAALSAQPKPETLAVQGNEDKELEIRLKSAEQKMETLELEAGGKKLRFRHKDAANKELYGEQRPVKGAYKEGKIADTVRFAEGTQREKALGAAPKNIGRVDAGQKSTRKLEALEKNESLDAEIIADAFCDKLEYAVISNLKGFMKKMQFTVTALAPANREILESILDEVKEKVANKEISAEEGLRQIHEQYEQRLREKFSAFDSEKEYDYIQELFKTQFNTLIKDEKIVEAVSRFLEQPKSLKAGDTAQSAAVNTVSKVQGPFGDAISSAEFHLDAWKAQTHQPGDYIVVRQPSGNFSLYVSKSQDNVRAFDLQIDPATNQPSWRQEGSNRPWQPFGATTPQRFAQIIAEGPFKSVSPPSTTSGTQKKLQEIIEGITTYVPDLEESKQATLVNFLKACSQIAGNKEEILLYIEANRSINWDGKNPLRRYSNHLELREVFQDGIGIPSHPDINDVAPTIESIAETLIAAYVWAVENNQVADFYKNAINPADACIEAKGSTLSAWLVAKTMAEAAVIPNYDALKQDRNTILSHFYTAFEEHALRQHWENDPANIALRNLLRNTGERMTYGTLEWDDFKRSLLKDTSCLMNYLTPDKFEEFCRGHIQKAIKDKDGLEIDPATLHELLQNEFLPWITAVKSANPFLDELASAIFTKSVDEVVELIRSSNADVLNEVGPGGNTLAHWLYGRKDPDEIVQIATALKEKGANLNELNDDGDKPLNIIVRFFSRVDEPLRALGFERS